MNNLTKYGAVANYKIYNEPATALVEDEKFINIIATRGNDITGILDELMETDLKVSEILNSSLENTINRIRINPNTYDISDEEHRAIEAYALAEYINKGVRPEETKQRVLEEINNRYTEDN